MIKPAKEDLLIYQGGTYDKRWTWKSDGVAVDLASATIRSQLRQSVQSKETYLDMSTEDGKIVIHDAPGGTFGIYLTAEQTAELNFTTAVYDLEIVWATGDVVRLLYGSVILSKEVTR